MLEPSLLPVRPGAACAADISPASCALTSGSIIARKAVPWSTCAMAARSYGSARTHVAGTRDGWPLHPSDMKPPHPSDMTVVTKAPLALGHAPDHGTVYGLVQKRR